MLTIAQKAQILSKAGIGVAVAAPGLSTAEWEHEVEIGYVAYSAERAARSLRQAEAARQNDLLRRMAWSGTVR